MWYFHCNYAFWVGLKFFRFVSYEAFRVTANADFGITPPFKSSKANVYVGSLFTNEHLISLSCQAGLGTEKMAFCCLTTPTPQPNISWAQDLADCSEVCLRWFSVAVLQKGIAGPHPNPTFWHFPCLDNSITVRWHQDTKAGYWPQQCFTLPWKDEDTAQTQTPHLHLALKNSFALIPALAGLPCLVFVGPFNGSASVSSISKPETIFTKRCKTWWAFVRQELLSMLLWICGLIHTNPRYFLPNNTHIAVIPLSYVLLLACRI